MRSIFVNLKRFEAPKRLGGLCPMDDPAAWISSVMDDTVRLRLGHLRDLRLVYFLPEGLLLPAKAKLASFSADDVGDITLGCQGVHWKDIAPGGNFGAFTSSLPATCAANLGALWAMIGHSEERRAKQELLHAYDSDIAADPALQARASRAIGAMLQAEILCALKAGLNVLLCCGETAEERGSGTLDEQKPRIERVIGAQLSTALSGIKEALSERQLAIGYEPVWAIGPGRIPPDKEYISYVSTLIQAILHDHLGLSAGVVYGGGLKEENAAMIGGIETVDGGLVGLTRFSGDIGFDVRGLDRIIKQYLS